MKKGFVGIVIAIVASVRLAEAQLKLGFYDQSCPRAEQIVQDFVHEEISRVPAFAAPLLRMQFHDCFVRGCDASILLNSTKAGNQTERTSVPDQTIRGFSFIDRVKALVEAECPGVVSCADIIALVARDAVVTIGGPSWPVQTGRRDGTISNATEARNNIPSPRSNLTTLERIFATKGLDLNDLVLLSGAHTIGIAHCSSFLNRLYNFTGKGDQDPSLDPEYAANLKARKCTSPSDNTTIVEMDPGSFTTFDLGYYKLLLKRRGLFQSDAALTTSAVTKGNVTQLANGPLETFFSEFGQAMVKMGQISVLTGCAGEIRKHCAFVN